MNDGRWQRRLQADDVGRARALLRHVSPESKYKGLVHICEMSRWARSQWGTLSVPHNQSVRSSQFLIAPQWLFAHFPYGDFFPALQRCHAPHWHWKQMGPVERRLCTPEHRIASLMVHMAGLRQEQWGRRSLMRALGVWHAEADAVVPSTWVSARAPLAAAAALRGPTAHRQAWRQAGPLLVIEGGAHSDSDSSSSNSSSRSIRAVAAVAAVAAGGAAARG